MGMMDMKDRLAIVIRECLEVDHVIGAENAPCDDCILRFGQGERDQAWEEAGRLLAHQAKKLKEEGRQL